MCFEFRLSSQASRQKLFEINEIYVTLDKGQRMTLTSGTCISIFLDSFSSLCIPTFITLTSIVCVRVIHHLSIFPYKCIRNQN